jgi:transposase
MITVDQKEIIRLEYFLNRKSMRGIAKELHHSRKTIRKAIYDPGVPEYKRRVPAPKRAIGPFVEIIQQWLKEDKQRPTKQRHRVKRIYERLKEEYGYRGSDRTVRREVGLLRGTVSHSYVPQTYQDREGGTFDFGEAWVILSGQKTKVHLGCLRLDYSSHYFVCALPTERPEALFEGHLRGLAYLGGVPGRIRYDNLKAAVLKIMTGKQRQEQAAWSLSGAILCSRYGLTGWSTSTGWCAGKELHHGKEPAPRGLSQAVATPSHQSPLSETGPSGSPGESLL